MANPKDKEFSTNAEVKRTDDFQKGVEMKETIIELAKELLESTIEDTFEKLGFEKTDKKAGFYGTGKSYGTGTEQNKFGVKIEGRTKSSLARKVTLGAKRVQSDIDFQYNGKLVSIEYKTLEAGFFRGVDAQSIPYTFKKTITVDGTKKSELEKAMKDLFIEAAKKEVGYLTSTKLGLDDKIDKSTTSLVNENNQSMKKLTLKDIFSSNEDLFNSVNESEKENIQQIKDKNTTPLSKTAPYNKGEKKAEKGKFLLFDKDDKELHERAEKSELGKDEYLKFVKGEMKKKFATDDFKALTPVEKKELFQHIDRVYLTKSEKEAQLNEDGGAPVAGVTASGPSGSGAGAYLTPMAFKKTKNETSYHKGKNHKRPQVDKDYNVVKSENFWTPVSQKTLDGYKKNHIVGAPGAEGVEVNSAKELEYASKGMPKNKKLNESVEKPTVKANLDLTKKKIFSEAENKEKGINKRYLVTEKTSEEYLKERWKKLNNFKTYESINECSCEDEPAILLKPVNTHKEEIDNSFDLEIPKGNPELEAHNLEETVTVQKPGSLFGLEYMFYKKDFLNESKKYILDLNSKVFVPNPNTK